MLQFFRPILHSAMTEQQTEEAETHLDVLRGLIQHHAMAGLQLLLQHHRMYSPRYATPLHSFCLLHICDALIQSSDLDAPNPAIPSTSEIATFCLDSLEVISLTHPVAAVFNNMFCKVLADMNLPIPPSPTGNERTPNYDREAFQAACERETYQAPTFQFVHNMQEGLGRRFVDLLQAQSGAGQENPEQMAEDKGKGKGKGKEPAQSASRGSNKRAGQARGQGRGQGKSPVQSREGARSSSTAASGSKSGKQKDTKMDISHVMNQ